MPPLDLLLLPLLGGFVFAQKFNLTRYVTIRSAGNRLFFYAALSGVVFLFVSTLFINLLMSTSPGAHIARAWHWIVPYGHSGKAAGAFILGTTVWWPLNKLGRFRPFKWLSEQAAVDREIQGKHDPFEMLLRQALGAGRQISITLRSGKVYIGKVATNFNPAHKIESILLILSKSGHRDPTTQELTIDIDYSRTHEKARRDVLKMFEERLAALARVHPEIGAEELLDRALQEPLAGNLVTQFETVVLMSEVVSASYFEDAVYEEYFKAYPSPD